MRTDRATVHHLVAGVNIEPFVRPRGWYWCPPAQLVHYFRAYGERALCGAKLATMRQAARRVKCQICVAMISSGRKGR